MKKILMFFFTMLACTHLQSNNINWSVTPTNISGVILNASNPVLAMDANGNSVAAWVEDNRVKASTHAFDGNWTPVVIVSAIGASSPYLVMDSSGNATLTWVGNGVIYASTKTLTGTWSTPTSLSNSGASAPRLGIDDAGNVIAAWVRAGNIESSTKLFGMNWQGRVIVMSNAAATPCIAIGGTGSNTRAVLVWQGTSNGLNVIYTSTKLLSGSWTSQAILSSSLRNAANPQVDVDSNANAIAVWYEYDVLGLSYTNVTVNSSERLSSTAAWNDTVALSEPGIRNPSSLSANIAFDSFGNAIAIWNTSFDDETFNMQSAIKPVNGQWSSAHNIIESNLFAYNESISVTNFGDTLGLFMYYNGSDLLIQSIESNINGYLNNAWSVPITVSQNSDNAYPKIAATIKGNKIYAAAIWQKYNSVQNSILATTGSKTLVLPPSNLSVTQNSNNFGVFTEYSNTLTWNASTDPNAVGYLIFRNGLFVEQVGAGVLSFIDDNRTLNGSVTYSITAIDAQQTQSAAVSVNFP